MFSSVLLPVFARTLSTSRVSIMAIEQENSVLLQVPLSDGTGAYIPEIFASMTNVVLTVYRGNTGAYSMVFKP